MFNSFDFIGKRKLWFGFSGLLIILSVVSIILFRFNWGIDFTGGTILELAFPKNVTVEEVRDGLRADGLETATIQLSGSNMQESPAMTSSSVPETSLRKKHRRSFLM